MVLRVRNGLLGLKVVVDTVGKAGNGLFGLVNLKVGSVSPLVVVGDGVGLVKTKLGLSVLTFSVLGTNPGGLLIFNTSKSLVAPLLLTACIVSLFSRSSSVLSVGSSASMLVSSVVGLLIFTTSRILVEPSLLTAAMVSLFSKSSTLLMLALGSSSISTSSSPGLLIFTTSRILVNPSLFTADMVTALGAKVVVVVSSLGSSFIVNFVKGILAKLATPGSRVGLSSVIWFNSDETSVVDSTAKKNQSPMMHCLQTV